MNDGLVVVKVGGSLFDLPQLGERLRAFLAPWPRTLIVPGGGALVDTVRRLDHAHGLGPETCHWLALQAMSMNARFLARLLPGACVVSEPGDAGSQILDAYPFFRADDERADRLPHDWQVTSDSLALRAAARSGARELVLLKSVAWDVPHSWTEAAEAGVVDSFFPRLWQQQRDQPSTRIVNFRGANESYNGARPV